MIANFHLFCGSLSSKFQRCNTCWSWMLQLRMCTGLNITGLIFQVHIEDAIKSTNATSYHRCRIEPMRSFKVCQVSSELHVQHLTKETTRYFRFAFLWTLICIWIQSHSLCFLLFGHVFVSNSCNSGQFALGHHWKMFRRAGLHRSKKNLAFILF